MKPKICTLAFAFSLFMALPGYASDPFQELDQEVTALSADHSAEFDRWYAHRMKAFNQWQAAYLADWDKLQQQSIQQWGDAQTASPSRMVTYDKPHAARTVVDLDKGLVTIEYIAGAQPSSAAEKAQIVNTVIKQNAQLWHDVGLSSAPVKATPQRVVIHDMMVSAETFDDVKQRIAEQTQRQMSQLDMFMASESSHLTPQQQTSLVVTQKQQMKQHEQQRLATAKTLLTKQAKTLTVAPKKVVSYQIRLPSSALKTRAEQFLPQITQASHKQHLPVSLVLAIVHTESHFNPRAKSFVPAYGLMQIVPTTAGHDVNKLYRGKDAPMTAQDLYNPTVNINTGTAYLNILQSRYLRGIHNRESAIYSMIAAYNTGAGNVAKAFGERHVASAIKKMNTMQASQVYQQLMQHLPYEETRHYLKTVNERMKTYQRSQTL